MPGGAIFQQLVKDGKDESGGFSRPGLSAAHQVSPAQDDRDGELLHGGRFTVPTFLNVFNQDFS